MTGVGPADEFHSPYVYVGGDPVNLVDPDGRQSAGVMVDVQAFDAAGVDPDQRLIGDDPSERRAGLAVARTGLELAADSYGDGFELLTGYTITGRKRNRLTAAAALAIPLASSRALKETATALKRYWPPDDGFSRVAESSREFLRPGTKIDRYGTDFGRNFSPEGTPLPERALPLGSAERPYSVFEVMKPLDVRSGKVAPAFGQPGQGVQYQTPVSVRTLLDKGFLKRVK